ncbi:MAG: type II secretion system protein GspM [Geminicoccaceae bacterium]
MTMTPGSWSSRLAALALLALLLLGAYHLIAAPASSLYRANEERIAQQSDLLQRYQRLAAGRSGLADRLADLEDRGQSAGGYWSGPSNALAAAQLQDRASEAIEGNGGEVVSVQTKRAGEPEEGASARRAELGLRLSASVDELALILQDLETATPYIFIDRLIALPRRTRRNVEEAGNEPELDVRLDVFGYLQNAEPPSASLSATEG